MDAFKPQSGSRKSVVQNHTRCWVLGIWTWYFSSRFSAVHSRRFEIHRRGVEACPLRLSRVLDRMGVCRWAFLVVLASWRRVRGALSQSAPCNGSALAIAERFSGESLRGCCLVCPWPTCNCRFSTSKSKRLTSRFFLAGLRLERPQIKKISGTKSSKAGDSYRSSNNPVRGEGIRKIAPKDSSTGCRGRARNHNLA